MFTSTVRDQGVDGTGVVEVGGPSRIRASAAARGHGGGRPRPGARGAHAPPRECLSFVLTRSRPYHAGMRTRLAIGVLAIAAACAVDLPGLVPGTVTADVEDPQVAAQIAAAREWFERGEAVQALAAIDALAARGVAAVDLQRLRQDVLRQRGRLGFVRSEAQSLVAAQPTSAMALYLLGRVSTGNAMADAFARATELAPASVWPWLGQAFACRDADPQASLAIYERLYRASDRLPVVAVAYANALRSQGQLREAIAVYEALTRNPETAGVGQLGLAQCQFALGGTADRQRGWNALLAAVERRPFDPGVHAVVREVLRLGLGDDQIEQLVDVLRAQPERMRDFARGNGVEVLCTLLQRSQPVHAALRELEGATVGRPALRRLQRRLLLQAGDVRAFLVGLADDLPAEVLADESNQVRATWRSLLDGIWSTADPLGTREAAVGLVAALRDAGLLLEAEIAAELARGRQPSAASELIALRDEVRRELAFEGALRRAIYDGYAAPGGGDLDGLLLHVRSLSLSILGVDVVGDVPRFQVPLVGEMIDPFEAGLGRHLARYNRHLALGRRAGGAVEGLLMTRLSVRDLPDDPSLPLPGRCREVVGFDRTVKSLSGVLGGDLAGVALLHHFLVDHDAVVEWAAAIADRRRIAAADGQAVLGDPVPVDTAPLDPLDVSWRLAAMSPGEDKQLEAAVLEVIRIHERRHLVDSFHYLPFESNLWRGLGLLLRHGLSPMAIEAEMERRAELAALAGCREPGIVLAHIAEFTGGDDASPHARGFTQLAVDLIGALEREGVPADAARICQWHRLEPGVVRRAAERLLRRLP